MMECKRELRGKTKVFGMRDWECGGAVDINIGNPRGEGHLTKESGYFRLQVTKCKVPNQNQPKMHVSPRRLGDR